MEGWKDGRVEGWKGGRVEGWKDGMMEGWKGGRMEAIERQGIPSTKTPWPFSRTVFREEGKKGPAILPICNPPGFV
jgi:hypothetical protein